MSVFLPGSGGCCFAEEENQTNFLCPGNAECLLSNVKIECVRCNQMNESHQTRASKGLSGDLDMTRMEWELLAFDISWEFDFLLLWRGRQAFPPLPGTASSCPWLG